MGLFDFLKKYKNKNVDTTKFDGECFEFWFYEILTSPEYLKKRKEELERLEADIENI